MRTLEGDAARSYVSRLANRAEDLDKVSKRVRRIVGNVRRDGDGALRGYAQRWDGLAENQAVQVDPAEISSAWRQVSSEFRSALRQAAVNVRQFAAWQKPKAWTRTQNGISVGQIIRPLGSVGCYVPGGRYPLPSTLLMTVIPAQVAGVKRIFVVSPQPRLETLAAAALLGVRELYRVGGAQAIAALAYGTESIPRVDKIVGPGNVYVTAAKKLVAFDCSIDFLAGPTEIVIVSHRGKPLLIASDLVAQAEHDPHAVVVFITTSRQLAKDVATSVTSLARNNPIARRSLANKGVILLASSRYEAMDWANRLAPEHITVDAEDLPLLRNAGSVFVGDYSPTAAGDYASGPNHVLPTGGLARCRGGLTVSDFLKIITVQQLTKAGLRGIAPVLETMAKAEGLKAHAQSVRLRYANA
ncbi:MAG: histidinol dehydrogenase [Acidobacteriales bacterium 13_2_20CM_55_8]|nr:MAG: histidinol dehydrogenase [Acidobacteriales bacterium 13_2_20CM_55_8]